MTRPTETGNALQQTGDAMATLNLQRGRLIVTAQKAVLDGDSTTAQSALASAQALNLEETEILVYMRQRNVKAMRDTALLAVGDVPPTREKKS